jgi:molecular chaperone IbpA
MKTIDLTPLYRSTIGFDRLGALLDSALRTEQSSAGYPPYNIEVTGENRYGISLAVAGFDKSELDIQVEQGVLRVRGHKAEDAEAPQYLYQGIATRTFERLFNLADYVQVTGAELKNGLLTISLSKQIPDEMNPTQILISDGGNVLEHDSGKRKGQAA